MKINALYIHTGISSFVEKDVTILKDEFELSIFYFEVNNKKKLHVSVLKQLLFLLKNCWNSKVIICQFAGFHTVIPALIARFTRKKCILILGGTDCVKFSTIDYGNFNRKILAKATEISIRYATLLLPVDDSLIEYKYSYDSIPESHQGCKAHIGKKFNTPYKVIYNGYDAKSWKNHFIEKEENSFVTIAGDLSSRFAFQLKGIDLICAVAPYFSQCKFYIVGGSRLKNKNVPKNVVLLDNIPNNELNVWLSSKSFYLQLSMSEGFPNALCEGILSGCIPIVSAVGAMPMIVQQSSCILVQKDLNLLVDLIQKLQNLSILEKHALQSEIRSRLVDQFSLERRKNELISTVLQTVNV